MFVCQFVTEAAGPCVTDWRTMLAQCPRGLRLLSQTRRFSSLLSFSEEHTMEGQLLLQPR